jgi:hypothetical protein
MRFLVPKAPLVLGGALLLSASCAGDFDDKRRKTEPEGTLGEDLFTALCDRVGASVLTEDVTGASYHDLCHRDINGNYGDTVDESKLPPVALDAAIVRKLAVAKLHAMARRRTVLIQALDSTFRDDELPNPMNPDETVRGHVALQKFLQRMGPLYDGNPIDKEGSGAKEGLMPSVTRSTARLFASLAGPGKDPVSQVGDPDKAALARQALSRLSGRLGYRPLRVALGAMRPSMAYPELRALTQTFAPKVRPGGPMRDAFQNVLGMAQTELDTSVQAAPPGPWALVDPVLMQPNRPRTNSEIARAIMLSTDPAFAAVGAQPAWMVTRDTRGYAVPAGNQPGIPGSVPAPFFDENNDGFADVDPLGRFLSGPAGVLAAVDTPFVVPGLARQLPPDQFGRAVDSSGAPLYQYFDTSQTFVAATTRDLEPLLNSDPALQSEVLADLLSGAFALYGAPVDAPAPWAPGSTYKTFDSQNSPMVDLMHATGWMFAHKSSDVHLKMVKQLFVEHEPLMARVLGAALKVREISNQFPDAGFAPEVTFWDEMQDIILETAKDPALFKDVLRALAHPDTQAYLGNAFSKYAAFKDELGYDPNNLNGPPINYSDASNPEPHIPPDYSQPDIGPNRSDFYRILQIIHDVNGVNACNKPGAQVEALGITLPGSYDECELFYFQDMGVFYLKSIIQSADFKLSVRPELLNLLLQIGAVFGLDANKTFEDGSGITGMTLKPTSEGLNRLVFFGSTSQKFAPFLGGQMPDVDPNINGSNEDTNDFISKLVEPVSTSVCPERLVNVPNPGGGDPSQLWLADCSPNVTWKHNGEAGNPNDLLRLRNRNTIFLWEKFEFYKAMRPVLKAFDDHGKGRIFLDSIEALYRHWPSPNHGAECNPNGNFADRPWKKHLTPTDVSTHTVNPAYNPRFCNASNGMSYEPILVQAFLTDLIPALGALVSTLDTNFSVIDDRNGGVARNGLDLLQEMTIALFDPEYAASVGMTDRFGIKTIPWANGQIVKPQLTPYDMFAQALRKFDELIPAGSERRTRWRNARSRLVDQFLGVDGEGTNAVFRNQAFIHSIPILVDVIRTQLNANCPDRETNPVPCSWAVGEPPPVEGQPILTPHAIAVKVMETFRGPTFATSMMLLEQINEDPDARRALQRHLRYLVQEASANDALFSMLASSADMMQILSDDENMPPIYNAVAVAAAPEGDSSGTGDRVVELMDALTRETNADGEPVLNPYDPYRVLDSILVNLVSPMEPGNPESLTPLEVFLDTIAEVNRIDSDIPADTPLSPDDMQAMFGTLRDFMGGKTRGMEQFYEIVRHRDGN